MGSVCADHHHHTPTTNKLHHHLLSKKAHFQDVLSSNIPPRKLISRTSSTDSDDSSGGSPYDPDSDPYSSDQFRIFEFKIRRCTRSRSHDWTDCPFAHPGEKARRRDPRKFHYSGSVCPEFRRSGACSRAEDCDFAHGVFEVWLHPSRYRTEACKDGKNCKRKVCFFAHSPRELRLLPSDSGDGQTDPNLANLGDAMMMRGGGGGGGGSSNNGNGGAAHCCKHCNCSPRSTLNLNNSPPLSPPSPAQAASQFAWASQQQMAYEDALGELMSSLEVMNFKEAAGYPGHGHGGLWVDVDHGVGDDQQFMLSPSTPMSQNPVSVSSSRGFNMGGGYVFDSPCSSSSGVGSYGTAFESPSPPVGYKGLQVNEQSKIGLGDPDLGWVNELLM